MEEVLILKDSLSYFIVELLDEILQFVVFDVLLRKVEEPECLSY
jgi:hypothetical protein